MGIVGVAFVTAVLAQLVSAQAPDPPQTTNSVAAEEREACKKNLLTIYDAIQSYEKQHKDLPNWLSDLVPDFLSDASVLTCPVCRRTGKIEGPPLADPKIATSYLFEFCPVPLGTSAPQAPHKTRRDWKRMQMELLGPVVPIVRCRHHNPVLNLSREGKIYESGTLWEALFTNRVSRAQLSASRLKDDDTSSETEGRTAKIVQAPSRDPSTRQQLLDLTGFYNAQLSDSWHGGTGNDLVALSPGLHTFGGVEFDVRGIIQLGGKSGGANKFPAQVKEIKVQQKCQRIHFLHSAGWGGVSDEGKQIGSYVVHFADNQTRLEIPIYYGRHVRNWHVVPGEPPSPDDLTVVWTGENVVSRKAGRSVRLFKSTWTNLVPDMVIESLDCVSSMDKSAPFLIAITLE
jgi:hypothetical protein